MIDRLKHVKETLMCAVEAQMYNLEEVDTKELGEAIDMIKDIEEAMYYCSVVKAMEDSEKNGKYEKEAMYYTPMYYTEGHGDMSRRYYNGNGGNNSSSNSSSGNGRGNSSQYSEHEFPMAFSDGREGRSPRSRRMYMEAKETKQDKATQMRELEKYMQELTQDVVEMIEDASPEERQYLSKKISALATKINQSNG